MTLDEEHEIRRKSWALREAGKEEEAQALVKTIPMLPWMAKIFKEKKGLDFLLGMGWNMSAVEETYGKKWLEH
jgi:hypothetical protein